jgi:hypothetical protein
MLSRRQLQGFVVRLLGDNPPDTARVRIKEAIHLRKTRLFWHADKAAKFKDSLLLCCRYHRRIRHSSRAQSNI